MSKTSIDLFHLSGLKRKKVARIYWTFKGAIKVFKNSLFGVIGTVDNLIAAFAEGADKNSFDLVDHIYI